jgi:opacity protein-like surface antigen
MKRILTSALLLLAGACAGLGTAHAQSPESMTGTEPSLTVGALVSGNYLEYGKRWLGGGGAWVDASINWRLTIEGEADWAILHQQSRTRSNTWLIGPRYQLNAMGSNYRYQPYVKFLIGNGHFNFPYNYGSGNYFVMAPGAGVDYRLSPKLRIRLADFEYQYWPGFTFGSTSNYSISTGVRYRIR